MNDWIEGFLWTVGLIGSIVAIELIMRAIRYGARGGRAARLLMDNWGDGLSFCALRRANPNLWPVPGPRASAHRLLQGLVAELGSLANHLKKVDRGDFHLNEARPWLSRKLGGVQVQLDCLAQALGVDLGLATRSKFNEVSERIGSPIYFDDACICRRVGRGFDLDLKFSAEAADGLSFAMLRFANIHRIRSSRYKRCERSWTTAHWVQATLGEVGELAELMIAVDLNKLTLEGARKELSRELADVQTYLDILALKLSVDLGEATRQRISYAKSGEYSIGAVTGLERK